MTASQAQPTTTASQMPRVPIGNDATEESEHDDEAAEKRQSRE